MSLLWHPSPLLVAVLPIPALTDWVLTSFTERRGYNVFRTLTGATLGFGYGIALVLLFVEHDLVTFLVGMVYAVIAGGLLMLKGTHERNTT